MTEIPDYLTFSVDTNAADTVSVYDEVPLWSATAGLLLLEHVPVRAGMTILDIGCGTGFPLFELAQRAGASSRVFGIDPWEAAIARARLKAKIWNVPGVEIRLGSAEAMPFPDGQFDLLVSNLGLNNFDHPELVLAECWRVSRPAARFALTTNLVGHMREFYEVFASTLLGFGDQEALDALQLHIHHRATVAGVTALFEKTGFRVAKVVEQQTSLRYADGSALLRHYFIKLGFLDAWKSVVKAKAQPKVFRRLESNLNNLAKENGELVLTIPWAYIEAERIQ